MNRRPSGYEGVSAQTFWTDCRKQHGMDGISAHSDTFQPDSSNWCLGVFPVVGQNVGQEKDTQIPPVNSQLKLPRNNIFLVL